ncbi:hypothetical protein [Mycobacteroides chelonae]|uniref:Uncharacterized protein n=1 Tax=Mycobacteroides chelonae TaxID=1774 RepID=A0A1S1M4I0_MYCCH|nr:hypothetical protein [Mycobacteroides chelonae]OHU77443.1 hypothetical protein BKG84_02565 [Mycobacteroides chelonae]QQG87409.1 hypothetical protein HBA99_09385 [Mycobacteroides chelonae]QQG92224.1 hypothetical protein HBA97_09385 [Mycobacteroides chelonae]
MNTGTASAWILRILDMGFVLAVALLCWALLWCDGPFERVSWLGVLAFMAGPPLLLFAAAYFGICASRERNVAVPLVVVAAMIGLSVIVIGTGVLQKLRWAQAWPEVLAVAEYPPRPGEAQRRRLGTYAADIYGNNDGTVLIAFGGSWDGLLYVPPGLPEPERKKYVGREVMPHWFYYDMD